eukprot:3929910-Pleurochrysis_carterae.AAC.4
MQRDLKWQRWGATLLSCVGPLATRAHSRALIRALHDRMLPCNLHKRSSSETKLQTIMRALARTQGKPITGKCSATI